MIPTLYGENETQFNSNGEGKLVDAISCVVTEERNGVYELRMEYPVDGEHSDDIGYSKYILATPSDGARPQAFQIYKISTPKNGKKTILANHISYRLSHIPSGTFTASNAPEALSKLKSYAYEPCPFDFMTDMQTSANYVQDAPASIRSRLGGTKGSLLDTYGGEYEFDMYNVKWLANRGSNNGVSLRYGKNIVDLNQEQNIENTITGICPYWKDPNGSEVVELPEKVIYSEHASEYPYHRTRVIDFTSNFEAKPTVAQLRTAANSYISDHQIGIPSVNIKVSFVPLWQTKEYADIAPLERVKLCDTVNVYFEKLKINATAKVIKTEYDVLMDRYKSISLGNASTSFADRFAQLAESNREMVSESFLQTAIARASALIQGGLGGYVVFNNNADGQPQEILIMDTPDIATAVHVIRINKNGIGFSNTGYSGTYRTAWTIDGHFVADWIDTGTLRAINIEGVNISGATITGNEITGGTIDGTAITGGTIDGNQITGSAISGGTISGTTVTGGTVNGATITSNNGIMTAEMGSGYFKTKNTNGTKLLIGNYNIHGYNDSQVETLLIGTDASGFINLLDADNHKVSLGAKYILLGNSTQQYFSATYDNGLAVKWDGKGFEAKDARIAVVNGTALKFYVNSDTGNTYVAGTLSVTGTKSRISETKNYGERLFYCYETPTPYFGDMGEGKTDESGKCYIFLDDILDESIEGKYQVFLQAYGDGRLYVSERTSTYFVVEGEPNIAFGWELKAPQKGYSLDRLEPYEQSVSSDDRETVLDSTYQYLTEQLYNVEGD